MEIQVSRRVEQGVPVLDVVGELDLYTSPKLKAAIEGIQMDGHTDLLVNLAQTTYLDSTALSILTAALKHAQEAGGNLGLIYDHPQIVRMFTITGLNEIFPTFLSEAEAIEAASRWTAD